MATPKSAAPAPSKPPKPAAPAKTPKPPKSSPLEDAFLAALHLRHPEHASSVEREVVFAPPRRWRADFIWSEKKLIVEVDGIYGQSRHRSVLGYHNDACKLNAATELGFRILRFTSKHIRSDADGCADMAARLLGSAQ